MVAHGHVVAGEAKDVSHAEYMGGQQIAEQRDAVAVAGHHLIHRLDTLIQQQLASDEGAGPHDGGLVIGDVHGSHAVREVLDRLVDDRGDIHALGRSYLAGEDEFACINLLLKFTDRLTHLSSSCGSSSVISASTSLLTPLPRSFRWSLGSRNFRYSSSLPNSSRRL